MELLRLLHFHLRPLHLGPLHQRFYMARLLWRLYGLCRREGPRLLMLRGRGLLRNAQRLGGRDRLPLPFPVPKSCLQRSSKGPARRRHVWRDARWGHAVLWHRHRRLLCPWGHRLLLCLRLGGDGNSETTIWLIRLVEASLDLRLPGVPCSLPRSRGQRPVLCGGGRVVLLPASLSRRRRGVRTFLTPYFLIVGFPYKSLPLSLAGLPLSNIVVLNHDCGFRAHVGSHGLPVGAKGF